MGTKQITEHKQTTEQRVSAALVETLVSQGKSLKEIGNIIDCTESFISHVRRGRRSFSLEHLLKFQESIGQPIALMLLDATEVTGNGEMQDLRNCIRSSINRFYKRATQASHKTGALPRVSSRSVQTVGPHQLAAAGRHHSSHGTTRKVAQPQHRGIAANRKTAKV